MNLDKTAQRRLLLLIFGLSLLGIAARLAPGFHNRFINDDFCTAASARAQPFVQFFAREYIAWTGRFSYVFVTGLAVLAGPRFAGFLPFLLTAAWYCALVWCVLPLLRQLRAEPAWL